MDRTDVTVQPIARLEGALPTKFGIPRQSGLVEALHARIVFEPAFRSMEAVRGLEEFSHIWLLWHFSETARSHWSPTVRPPRLGGNVRMGVFATRSPFRPNGIGLSCVGLERVEHDPLLGPVLHVTGADLMHGTPILDIKPYLPYADSRPQARAGFAQQTPEQALRVEVPPELLARVPEAHRAALEGILAHDPRPAYHDDGRVYGLPFAGLEIKFTVQGDVLRVLAVDAQDGQDSY